MDWVISTLGRGVKERPELFGGRMCQQMLRDVERMEEYGATNR